MIKSPIILIIKVIILFLLLPVLSSARVTKPRYPDKILLNDKFDIANLLQESEINKALGKPDSIVKLPFGGMTGALDTVSFYQNLTFSKYKDTLGFVCMTFSKKSKNFLRFGSLRLSGSTTMNDVQNHFQVSVRFDTAELEMSCYPPPSLPGCGSGLMVRLLAVGVCADDKINKTNAWFMYFYKGYLIKIESWEDNA